MESFKGPLFKVNSFFFSWSSNSCGVLTVYLGSKSFSVKKQASDRNGRIFLLDATLDQDEYILINLYNANNEQE